MTILYESHEAEEQFSQEYATNWRYPELVKEKLIAAQTYIAAAESLWDMFCYPPFRFHRLEGKRKREWAFDLGRKGRQGGYRVTCYPCRDDGTILADGDILSQSKTIKIIMVTEVSNHYR